MKIAMIGTGYVGLTSGTCFAELGHDVICIDKDEGKIDALQQGQLPIFEPDLEELVSKNVAAGRLRFSCNLQDSLCCSEVIFIALPTPPLQDGSVDLSYIDGIARSIAGCMKAEYGYRIIVDKSTVPVSTASKVEQVLRLYSTEGVEIEVVSNPEFLREGNAVHDLLCPDRIVIGASSQRAFEVMRRVYAPLDAPLVEVDLASAELIKHAANSFLAMKISYINAVAAVCEVAGADVEQVARGIGMDQRIAPHFLQAGLGYGGSCFPKDIRGFVHIAEHLGAPLQILEEVERINAAQWKRFLSRVRDKLWILKHKRIAVWGLSFKENTDDVRESVALRLIKALCQEGAIVHAYDPVASKSASTALKGFAVRICDDPYSCAKDADALIIATAWGVFARMDFEALYRCMHLPLIFDGCNMLPIEPLLHAGFEYHSVGRKSFYPTKTLFNSITPLPS